jgi:hypothetical protein
MGADIHIMLERKLGSGEWAAIDTFQSKRFSQFCAAEVTEKNKYGLFARVKDRNYTLFAALAGVRGEGPEPRGMPKDASPLAWEDFSSDDLHSHSWMLATEFMSLFIEHGLTAAERAELVLDRMERTGPVHEVALYRYISSVYFDEGESMDDYRFVFCFDN